MMHCVAQTYNSVIDTLSNSITNTLSNQMSIGEIIGRKAMSNLHKITDITFLPILAEC